MLGDTKFVKKEFWGSGGGGGMEMVLKKIDFLSFQVSSEAISDHTITLNQEHSHYAGFVRGIKS